MDLLLLFLLTFVVMKRIYLYNIKYVIVKLIKIIAYSLLACRKKKKCF